MFDLAFKQASDALQYLLPVVTGLPDVAPNGDNPNIKQTAKKVVIINGCNFHSALWDAVY